MQKDGKRPLEKSRSYTMVRGVRVAGVMVDPVLWKRLSSTLEPDQAEALVAHVVRNRSTSQMSIVYGFLTRNRESLGTWDPVLRQGSIGLTAFVGTADRRISWRDGVIVLDDMPLAATVARGLVGRPLGDMMDHPLLPLDAPIGAVHVANRTTTVTMAVKGDRAPSRPANRTTMMRGEAT